MVSTETVAAAMGAGQYAQALEDGCIQFGIVTALQKAHFLAQVAHESDGFRTATEYASGRAYEGRADLGNVQPGDGMRFKGRGLIQLTGRENYATFSNAMGQGDLFVRSPELVAQLPWAVSAAGWFWKRKGLNALADRDDVVAVTRRINGGTNGLEDRKRRLAQAKKLFRLA
ncbi:glycoside hydrolase family 19 protein [Stenotrophomonas tuberculopleuritidis]|uniref:glycoside hydrolase family 19 protein n=1 Tax=Stenotrophomonas tuberculopleuritidis TaxID=3055079 RepID=UPI0026E58BEB|nr:glycoside hydrolase family 19 protein [Stenotrophomonas sp. 704A1]